MCSFVAHTWKHAARLSFVNSFQLAPIVIFTAAIEDEGDLGPTQRRRSRRQSSMPPSRRPRMLSAPSAPQRGGRPLGTGRPKGGSPARKRVMNARRRSLPRLTSGHNLFNSTFYWSHPWLIRAVVYFCFWDRFSSISEHFLVKILDHGQFGRRVAWYVVIMFVVVFHTVFRCKRWEVQITNLWFLHTSIRSSASF